MRYPWITSCAIASILLGGGVAGAQAPARNQPSGQPSTEQSQPNQGAQRQSEPTASPKQSSEEKNNANSGRPDMGERERRGEERSEGNRDRFDDRRRSAGDEGRREERGNSNERDYERNRSGRFDDQRYGGRYEDRHMGGRYEERGYEGRRYEDRRNGRAERGYEGPRHLQISRRQRSRVHDVLVRRQVAPANIDFPVRIGARIPNYLTTYDLPDEIYDYAPGYEGYRYFVTNDEVVIVDPETMEVVAVLEH
jgi:uncharacterized protein DUF1236